MLRITSTLIPVWPAALIWALFATGLFVLDGWWSLGNLALLLVLGSTMASYWLSTSVSILVSAVAVAGFNWFFIEPRYTFHVQLDQDLLLLITMLGTSTLISVLTSRLRQHAMIQTEHARQAERLQQLGAELQRATSVQELLASATVLLGDWAGVPAQIWLNESPPDSGSLFYRAWTASQHEQHAVGSGTGRFDSLNVIMIPLWVGVTRIGTLSLGPSLPGKEGGVAGFEKMFPFIRLLTDAIQRLQASLEARVAQERLQSQQLRNTLLAAISHDYRTPLATITGAASGLLDEKDILRVRQAARTILEESEHLHRVTTNTLQMARLDALDDVFQTSWESVEELCGVAITAARRRHQDRKLEAQVQPFLPFLKCDPVLMVQLLDNLLENALRYSPADAPVDLVASQNDRKILIQVLDRGIGIPAAWKERVFAPFMRVLPEGDTGFSFATRRGMGLGLALCQSIARVHHAQLWIEDRQGGGTVVSIQFNIEEQPVLSPAEASHRGEQ
jgi:two-component system sensor histidine kinase KdpD